MNSNSVLLIILIVSAVVLLWATWKLKAPGSVNIFALSVIVMIWAGLYLAEAGRPVWISGRLMLSLLYAASSAAAILLMAFSFVYSNTMSDRGKYVITLLLFEPVLTQILLWSPTLQPQMFLDTTLHSHHLFRSGGFWPDLHIIYLYSLESFSVLLITDVFFRKPRSLLFESGTVLAGVFAPIMFRVVNMIGLFPSHQYFDYSLLAYALAMLGFAVGVFRSDLVEVLPVMRDAVINGMNDGWMVLDLKNRIIDINSAAENILGISYARVYGKPIRSVLPDWPEVSAVTEGIRELEIRRSMRAMDEWRYLNVRISTLKDSRDKPFGQLIVWRDITERKLVEDARHRARDEMFIILNAISNAASRSMTLDDFLSESIYQLIYPFQSQVVAVFLIDEDAKPEARDSLHVASHFGLPIPGKKDLKEYLVPMSNFIPDPTSIQPLVFEHASLDRRLPKFVREADVNSVVALPMVAQHEETSRVLGVLLLGRKSESRYMQDEVIRLTAIAEQITNLIDSDRRRQLAIAFSERERLMRDLHDSVSQKLYGLVTLTEAAQAGLEAGSKVSLSDVLTRIGEGARQAVKEMRLFLFEMQPMDLQKEGLITVLHHRLAAVEGRADIQAGLVADEDISISKEKEIALYYIAQEALNNVLKHAHAKSVSVNLRQTRQNVILEITDNGRGFNPKKVERGGMGLQNMKARAAQINGRLKVDSKTGAGAKITITVARDKTPVTGRRKRVKK